MQECLRAFLRLFLLVLFLKGSDVMKRKIWLLILSLILCFGTVLPVFGEGNFFKDTKDSWALPHIRWALGKGLVEGYPDGTFRPEGTITRGEFYALVNRMGKFKVPAAVPFSDVKETHWFYKDVAVALGTGYLKGHSGKLYPNEPITREETSEILAGVYLLAPNPQRAEIFKDTEAIKNLGAIGSLVAMGVLEGYPDGTFRPEGAIKRGEMAKILHVIVEKAGDLEVFRNGGKNSEDKSSPKGAEPKKKEGSSNYYKPKRSSEKSVEKPVYFGVLQSLLIKAKSLSTEDKTKAGKRALEEAIFYGERLLESEGISQREVDLGCDLLERAMDGLEVKLPTRGDLEKKVREGEGITLEAYTEESVSSLLMALEKGREVLKDERAKGRDYKEAIDGINLALGALEEKPKANKEALLAKYEEGERFKEEYFTEESWKPFPSEMDRAKRVLDKVYASEEEVKKALHDLAEVMEAMVPSTYKVVFEGATLVHEPKGTLGVDVYPKSPEGTSLKVMLGDEEILPGEDGLYHFSWEEGPSVILTIRAEVLDSAGNPFQWEGKTVTGRQVITYNPLEVLEYVPAPGQFVNTSFSKDPGRALKWKVPGNFLTLGNFGGYVTVKTPVAIKNDPANPYGVDFTVIGNAFQVSGKPGVYNQEQATVWVSKDVNGNGKADDPWYELAGSEYYKEDTVKGYSLTYTNPKEDKGADVPWVSNLGDRGVVKKNGYHKQPYYPLHEDFPNIHEDSYTLTGTLLFYRGKDTAITMDDMRQTPFGYGDSHGPGRNSQTHGKNGNPDNPYTYNTLEGMGWDAMDISWAVDAKGQPVDLDEIHFIKVVNALNIDGGSIGEQSAEIGGIVPSSPVEEKPASLEILLAGKKNFVLRIDEEGQLLAKGKDGEDREVPVPEIQWTSGDEGILTVHPVTGVLTPKAIGKARVTGTLKMDPSIKGTLDVEVTKALDKKPAYGYITATNPVNVTSGVLIYTPHVYNGEGVKIAGDPKEELPVKLTELSGTWNNLTPAFNDLKAFGSEGKYWSKVQKEGKGMVELAFENGYVIKYPFIIAPKGADFKVKQGGILSLTSVEKPLKKGKNAIYAVVQKSLETGKDVFSVDAEVFGALERENKRMQVEGATYGFTFLKSSPEMPKTVEFTVRPVEMEDDVLEGIALSTEEDKALSEMKVRIKMMKNQLEGKAPGEYKVFKITDGKREALETTYLADQLAYEFTFHGSGLYVVGRE